MSIDYGQCDGRGRQYRRRRPRGKGGRSGRLTATGAVVSVGAYLTNDLRDPEGLARPVLRRAARALAASRRAALKRAGTAYLRLDPPLPDELERARGDASAAQPSGSPVRDDRGVVEDADLIELDGEVVSEDDDRAAGGSVSASGDEAGPR